MDNSTERHNEDGFVLISVLWALALLAALGLSLALAVRLDINAKSNLIRKAEVQYLADGLARYVAAAAVGQSNASPDYSRFRVDGHNVGCQIGERDATFSVKDVVGLVDLNAAPAEVLVKIGTSAGLTGQDARELALAIIDYRDGDKRLSNALLGTEGYGSNGVGFGPKNAPFEAVSELDQVRGMTPELYSRIAPLTTVYSRRPDVDFSVSPLPILKALVAGDKVGQLRSLERVYEARANTVRALIGGRAFDVLATVYDADGTLATRHAVVEVEPEAPLGFVFREWDLGFGGESAPGAPVSTPCFPSR